MTPSGDDRYEGTEAGTAAMLYAGAITGVLLRGATWLFSGLTVGPVLGVLDLLAGGYSGERTLLFAQAVLTVAAVVTAVFCAVGLQTDPGWYRRPVRLLSWLFILDVL